jgi:hypothetical protein
MRLQYLGVGSSARSPPGTRPPGASMSRRSEKRSRRRRLSTMCIERSGVPRGEWTKRRSRLSSHTVRSRKPGSFQISLGERAVRLGDLRRHRPGGRRLTRCTVGTGGDPRGQERDRRRQRGDHLQCHDLGLGVSDPGFARSSTGSRRAGMSPGTRTDSFEGRSAPCCGPPCSCRNRLKSASCK